MRHAARIKIDQLAVAGAGLEQIAGALVAARLDIDHHADPGARAADRAETGCAPSRPASSPSVNSAMTGWAPCTPPRLQGADGLQQVATPEPSSPAPGPAATESRCAISSTALPAPGDTLGDDVGDGAAGDAVPAPLAIAAHAGLGAGDARPSPPVPAGCGRAPLRLRRCRPDAAAGRPARAPSSGSARAAENCVGRRIRPQRVAAAHGPYTRQQPDRRPPAPPEPMIRAISEPRIRRNRKYRHNLNFRRNIPILQCSKSRAAIRAAGHGRHMSRPFSGACYDQCDDLRRGSRN